MRCTRWCSSAVTPGCSLPSHLTDRFQGCTWLYREDVFSLQKHWDNWMAVLQTLSFPLLQIQKSTNPSCETLVHGCGTDNEQVTHTVRTHGWDQATVLSAQNLRKKTTTIYWTIHNPTHICETGRKKTRARAGLQIYLKFRTIILNMDPVCAQRWQENFCIAPT